MAQKSYIHKPAYRPMDCRTLAQLHDYHTDLHPQREAFVIYDIDGNRSVYTFQEVKEKSVEIAALLLQIGIKRNHRIAVMAPDCIEFVWCLLALNRIGANMIPINMYGDSEEEVKTIIQHLKCQAFLFYPSGNTNYNNNLLESVGNFLDSNFIISIKQENNNVNLKSSVKNLWKLLQTQPQLKENEVYKQQDMVQFDDHAIVTFTSGSTGHPKAVQYTHHAVVNEAFIAGKYLLGVSEDEEQLSKEENRLFNDRPFNYAACLLTTLINVFANGCTLVTIPPPVTAKRRQMELVLNIMQNEKCTQGVFAPYLIHDLINFPRTKEFNLERLKCFFTSGQSVPFDHYAQLQKLIPSCALVYTYATSEIGVIGAKTFDLSAPSSLESMDIIPSVEVKIINRDTQNVVPVGERGEICVRKPASFCEYLEDPKDEIRDISPNGWIYTDDAGYIDEQGNLHVLGRMHEVISKAIKKVYPSTIERVLSQYPEVKAVVVIGVPDERLYEEICACVIPKPGSSLEKSVAEFEQWASLQFFSDDLELSRMPKHILVFQEFPMTKTGKTNRKAVKALALQKLGLNSV